MDPQKLTKRLLIISAQVMCNTGMICITTTGIHNVMYMHTCTQVHGLWLSRLLYLFFFLLSES